MPLSHKTHPLITGTILLTAAGLLSRVLGFFYRIFLSRTIGAEGLGIYQMIFPVYGIFLSVCIEKQIPVTVSLAVFGLVAGEAGSALFVLIFFLLFHEFHENTGRPCRIGQSSI